MSQKNKGKQSNNIHRQKLSKIQNNRRIKKSLQVAQKRGTTILQLSNLADPLKSINGDEKLKWLLKVKCVQQVSTKIKAQRKVNDTDIFVDEVETQLREKPLRGSQTQEFHYSEDKARYKKVTLTCTDAVVVPWSLTCNPTRTLPNHVHLPEGVFNGTLYLRANL
jgi:hypothetical protein